MRPRQLTLFLILLTLSGPLYGYSSPNLPVDDPVYRDIDKLIAAGLVKDVIYGQRPWSRREIARMIFVSSERRKNSPEEEEAKPVWRYVDQILARLKEEFHEELVDSGRLEGERKSSRIHPVEKADFDYTLLDSPFRTVPRDNGLADTDAQINPLTAYRGGRHYVDGSTLGLETTHTAKLSKYLSLYARPRLETSVPNTGAAEVNLLPQNLYAKTAYERFALQAGRDSLIWGQGEHGGLLLSDNARPLDMIKLGTDSPLSLPWILKYAGPTGFQIFFAAMGPERNDYPNAILSGYKLTLKPVAFFEIAVNHVVMMGGDGANDPGFWEALGEFTGAKGTFTGNKRQDAFTNRLFSIEGRWTLPFFRNSVFYAEVGFDDTYSTLKVLFEDNAMYLAGIYIPRLDASGRLDLRRGHPGVAQ
ncbi:MAG: hypothetical protein HY542_00285 [Deltaproteobacteria bacterium]|nr:hypothetical protein [Deltaproteobacteria bacterium]